MSKQEYRAYFHDVSRYVKMKNILEDLGMTTANFYRFQKGSEFDWCMSEDTLERIKVHTTRTLRKIT
ncbi:hypothetical protein [Erysipelothrix aquatica]|uniref:hypothetical protein n=1 Tax=Erysipelothrix aquatica TaxID=2683714 RepID=UPI001358FF7D|nr:hypothetical protein [Erysipelothrix aquatica]